MRTTLLPVVVCALGMTACVATAPTSPAPVADPGATTRIEAAGPVKAAPAGDKTYTVRKGDTLYSIALEKGVDYRDLAMWNGIENPSRIKVGQTLRVVPAEAAPVAARSLDEAPTKSGPAAAAASPAPASAVAPAPTSAVPAESLKRGPLGGKLPYSEQNLALLKQREAATPAPAAAAPAQPAPAPVAAVAPAPTPVPPAAPENIDWAWPSSGKLLANFSEGGNGVEASKGIDIAGKIGDPVQAAASGKVIYVGQMNKYGNLAIVLHGDGYSSVYAHNSRILVKEGQMVTCGQKIAELGNSDADQPKLHFELRQQGKPVDPMKFLPSRR